MAPAGGIQSQVADCGYLLITQLHQQCSAWDELARVPALEIAR